MKKLTLTQRNDTNIFDATLESDGNERFLVNSKIQIGKDVFTVRESVRTTREGSFPIHYRVVLSKAIQSTYHNVRDINFLHVHRVERVSTTKIKITTNLGVSSEFGYPNAETCLGDYVMFNRIWRESASGIKENRLEY